MPLNVIVEKKVTGTYIVRPEGSIDTKSSADLAVRVDTLLEKAPKVIIFDLKDVGFLCSAGVSVIFMAERSLRDKGGKVLMVNLQPQFKKVFDIVQAFPAKHVFTNVEEMDRYLEEIQSKLNDGEIK
jgi:anti-anti-sigma factor